MFIERFGTIAPQAQPGSVPHIRRAVLFSLCAGMRTLIRHRDMLGFEIAGVVDFAGYGNPGADVGRLLYEPETGIPVYPSLDAFRKRADTVIIGSLLRYGNNEQALAEQVIEQAICNQMNIICPISFKNSKWDLLTQRTNESGLLWWNLNTSACENANSELPSSFPYRPAPVVAVLSVDPDDSYEQAHLAIRTGLKQLGQELLSISADPYSVLLGADKALPWSKWATMSLEDMIPRISLEIETAHNGLTPDIVTLALPNDSVNIPQERGARRLDMLHKMMLVSVILRIMMPDGFVLSSRYGVLTTKLELAIRALTALGSQCLGVIVDNDCYIGEQYPFPVSRLQTSEMFDYLRNISHELNVPCASADDPDGIMSICSSIAGHYELNE